MKVTREFCDVCRIAFQAKQDKHGLCITIGHSAGGWGHRENILNWSGEVCGGCYARLGTDIALAWKADLRILREGSPAPRPPPAARVLRKSWRDKTLERIRQYL